MAAELTLHLERVLRAPRPLVFRMHAEPDLLAQWWGPKGFSAPSIELDVRVGGGYRIAMQPPDGDRFFLLGEFREVNPVTRLVYTFRWEPPDPDDRETVVAFSLRELGESTALTVDQGPFATEGRRALHEQGWTDSLDRLEELITSRDWFGARLVARQICRSACVQSRPHRRAHGSMSHRQHHAVCPPTVQRGSGSSPRCRQSSTVSRWTPSRSPSSASPTGSCFVCGSAMERGRQLPVGKAMP